MLFNGLEAGPGAGAMGLGVLPIRESSVYVVWWPDDTAVVRSPADAAVWPWARRLPMIRGSSGRFLQETPVKVMPTERWWRLM